MTCVAKYFKKSDCRFEIMLNEALDFEMLCYSGNIYIHFSVSSTLWVYCISRLILFCHIRMQFMLEIVSKFCLEALWENGLIYILVVKAVMKG